jgi:energy-converting hydrogenase Eha subunit A
MLVLLCTAALTAAVVALTTSIWAALVVVIVAAMLLGLVWATAARPIRVSDEAVPPTSVSFEEINDKMRDAA